MLGSLTFPLPRGAVGRKCLLSYSHGRMQLEGALISNVEVIAPSSIRLFHSFFP